MSSTPRPTPRAPDLRALVEADEKRQTNGWMRWVTVLGPIALTLALLCAAWVVGGWDQAVGLVVAAVAIFTVAGKFAIFAGVGGSVPFSPWEIAAIVAYMDMMIGVMLVFNLPTLYRLPGLGPRLEELADHGHHMLEVRPWLARITLLGVIAFVMFPLTGTGAIGGSIFGRLLGLSNRRTLAGIATGAVLGCSLMALFADTFARIFTEELRRSWEFQAAGLAVVLALLALIYWRGRKLSAQLKARRLQRNAEDSA